MILLRLMADFALVGLFLWDKNLEAAEYFMYGFSILKYLAFERLTIRSQQQEYPPKNWTGDNMFLNLFDIISRVM